MRNVFVSYNFRDHASARSVKTFFQAQGGRCQGTPVFVEGDFTPLGDEAIDQAIIRVIDGCVAVLFVIGNDNHNSPWIDREAELAISRNMSLVAVRLPETTGGLPNRLAGRSIPFVEWGHNALCDALNAGGEQAQSKVRAP